MPMKQPAYLNAIAVEGRTGTAASNAVTLNAESFIVTTESLSTAAAAEYTCTMTNNTITANSIILWSVGLGSSTAGTPGQGGVTVTAGTAVFTVTNLHASNAFNGTLKITGVVLNPKGT